MSELKKQKISQEIDVRRRVCPYPLVLTKKMLEKMDSHQTLKVLLDAQASAEDTIPKFCDKNGHEMQSVKIEGSHWEIYIKKA